MAKSGEQTLTFKSVTDRHPETRYKFYKFCKNRARDTPLQGVHIPHFGQILVKISVFGSYSLIFAPIGVKFGTEKGTAPPCQISPIHPIGATLPFDCI